MHLVGCIITVDHNARSSECAPPPPPRAQKSTRNISWMGKGGRCIGLTTLPPSCANYLEIWELQPPGTLRVRLGL